jgi:drug/metabolite transporter (DMT)-like permease
MTRLRSILSESLLVLCMPFYALYLLLVPARVQRTPARRQQLRTRWMIAGAALVFVALPLLVTNGSLATQPTLFASAGLGAAVGIFCLALLLGKTTPTR